MYMWFAVFSKAAGLATPIVDYLPSSPSALSFAAWAGFLTFFGVFNMVVIWSLPTGGLIASLNTKNNPKVVVKGE